MTRTIASRSSFDPFEDGREERAEKAAASSTTRYNVGRAIVLRQTAEIN
jgi:hypothetical protein